MKVEVNNINYIQNFFNKYNERLQEFPEVDILKRNYKEISVNIKLDINQEPIGLDKN